MEEAIKEPTSRHQLPRDRVPHSIHVIAGGLKLWERLPTVVAISLQATGPSLGCQLLEGWDLPHLRVHPPQCPVQKGDGSGRGVGNKRIEQGCS